METGHQLFVHGLNDILDVELQQVEALRELSQDLIEEAKTGSNGKNSRSRRSGNARRAAA